MVKEITQPIAARQAEERDWISANTKLKTEATPAQAGGEYAMLNPWMCITEQEAIQNVNAARNAGDMDVCAVPYKLAIAAPALLAALKDICDYACWSLGGPNAHISEVPSEKIENARAAISQVEGCK